MKRLQKVGKPKLATANKKCRKGGKRKTFQLPYLREEGQAFQ